MLFIYVGSFDFQRRTSFIVDFERVLVGISHLPWWCNYARKAIWLPDDAPHPRELLDESRHFEIKSIAAVVKEIWVLLTPSVV